MQVFHIQAAHLIFHYVRVSFENAPFEQLLGLGTSVRWREDGASTVGHDGVDEAAEVKRCWD